MRAIVPFCTLNFMAFVMCSYMVMMRRGKDPEVALRMGAI